MPPPSRSFAAAGLWIIGLPFSLAARPILGQSGFPWGSGSGSSFDRYASLTLRMIACAQADFQAKGSDENGTKDAGRHEIAGLYTLTDSSGFLLKLIPGAHAANGLPVSSVASVLPSGPRSRHGFRTLVHEGKPKGDSDRFAACAYPVRYGQGSQHTFIIDESNTMYRKDFGRAGCFVKVFPADPLRDGWTEVD